MSRIFGNYPEFVIKESKYEKKLRNGGAKYIKAINIYTLIQQNTNTRRMKIDLKFAKKKNIHQGRIYSFFV